MTVYLPIFTELTNRLGEAFKERDPNSETGAFRNVTLTTVLVHVLDNKFKGDENMKATEQQRFYDLIKTITEAEQSFKPAGLLPSDVEMLKERIFRAGFTTQMYGRAIEILDAAVAKSKEIPVGKASKA